MGNRNTNFDFRCFEEGCDGVICFSPSDLADRNFQAVCPACHRAYVLDKQLRDKLDRLVELVETLRRCEDVLGDSMVSVNVAQGEVRIPYAMLLTRLNTLITLEVGNKKVDFHLRIEPTGETAIR